MNIKIPKIIDGKISDDIISDEKCINAVTKRYTGTINIDGTNYSNANIICFRRIDDDNVGIEIGILTYPNINKRLVYRFCHGGPINTPWVSIT